MPHDRDVEHVGDFAVSESEKERAERVFGRRSKRSRASDKAFRAPIAPNLDTWENNPRGLDYPGVDTPTDRPRHSAQDFPLPGDTAADDGIGLMETGRTDSLQEFREEKDAALDSLAEAVTEPFDIDL